MCVRWVGRGDGEEERGIVVSLVKVNSHGMEGKPQSVRLEVLGGEREKFSPRLGNTSIINGPVTVLFSLPVC